MEAASSSVHPRIVFRPGVKESTEELCFNLGTSLRAPSEGVDGCGDQYDSNSGQSTSGFHLLDSYFRADLILDLLLFMFIVTPVGRRSQSDFDTLRNLTPSNQSPTLSYSS